MKKTLVALLMGCASIAGAVVPATVNRASRTVTNDSAYISSSTYLDKVIVTSPIVGGILGVYDSTFSNAPSLLISSVSLFSTQQIDFQDLGVRGIYYVTTGNGGLGVTILYKK